MTVMIEEQRSTTLPPSLVEVLARRGMTTAEKIESFLNPSLDQLASPHVFGQMKTAVDRLLLAVKQEQPIAIYADRDVDGLTGLAVLARSLRTLGAEVVWGSPMKGRGVDRTVLERLAASGAKVMVLVDCGTGEHAELEWLASQGIDVIVADHHRFSDTRPPALAWIHPGVLEGDASEVPAGCVMAFKLAHALWQTFLGDEDAERMDYFLFSHLDLISMGILADRMPLVGENRIFVWHGLRRLAYSRKTGVASLARFFRLTPRATPLTVREVTWRLIPLLNAGGRLGRPDVTAELLLTEDADAARDCIDQLLELNTQRRAAQVTSLESFEKAVLEQCSVESDTVLIALAEGLEPSVTGLAAQALVRKYGRPTFLFVSQGDEVVGSGRGLPGVDLFAWVETHQEHLVKFGGHQGAVGLTVRTADFAMFRERLLATAMESQTAFDPEAAIAGPVEISDQPEARVALSDLNEFWWLSLDRLSPFGAGHPLPLFEIHDVETISAIKKRRSKNPPKEFMLKCGSVELKALPAPEGLTPRARIALDEIIASGGEGPWTVVGYPLVVKGEPRRFDWIIRDIWRTT